MPKTMYPILPILSLFWGVGPLFSALVEVQVYMYTHTHVIPGVLVYGWLSKFWSPFGSSKY